MGVVPRVCHEAAPDKMASRLPFTHRATLPPGLRTAVLAAPRQPWADRAITPNQQPQPACRPPETRYRRYTANYRLDANREFFGVGAGNVGAGFLGGFPVNGSQSRSFVLSDAGAKSQVANLWAAVFVLLTLLVLAPVFAYLPDATLAGVVIVAGLGLLDTVEFGALWRYRRTEFWMGAFTIFAVLIIGMLGGILVAVALSLLVVVLRASSPHTAVLGRIAGTDTYRDVEAHTDTTTFPGLLIYRFDAPIFFANATRMRDDIASAIEEAEQPIAEVLLDAEAVTDVDSTGAQVLVEMLDRLDQEGIGFALARVRTAIQDELGQVGIVDRLAGDGIHLEVDDGVTDYLRRTASAKDGEPPPDGHGGRQS